MEAGAAVIAPLLFVSGTEEVLLSFFSTLSTSSLNFR
jgi:hypothetical protein